MIKSPRLDTLARVAHTVIHRINYPKKLVVSKAIPDKTAPGGIRYASMSRKTSLAAKSRPLLSKQDCEEVRQTCALVLHLSGALYREKLTLDDWRACFRASRAAIRIDRDAHEDATDIATLEKTPLLVTDPHTFTARRSAIARRVRYARACIAAATAADTSRKRVSNARNARRFLRFLASQANVTGWGQGEISSGDTTASLRMAAMVFRRYVANGEELLEKEPCETLSIAAAIQRNYERTGKRATRIIDEVRSPLWEQVTALRAARESIAA